MEEKKQAIEQATLDEYRTLMKDTPGASSQLDMHALKDKIQRLHKQAREVERDLKKRENEEKILEFHK